MDRRHLEYLVAIQTHGGFARAASALHVTQSAISQTIAQLERELDVGLFHRNVRPVRLTPAGEQILDLARQTLRSFSTITAAAESVTGLKSGYLEVASLPTLAQWPATPLLEAFRHRYPGVRLHIRGPSQPVTADLAEMIRQGDCEIGLTEKTSLPDGLVAIDLGQHDYVAALPPQADVPGRPLEFAEIFRIGLIVGPWWETSRHYRVLREAMSSAVDDAVVIRIDHRDAYIPLVLAGAGAAILPRFAGEIARGAGASLAELATPITREVVLIHRTEELTPAAKAFCALVPPVGRGQMLDL